MASYVNARGTALSTSGTTTKSVAATRAGQLLAGTSGNDALRTTAGGASMAGGAGDDTYYVYSASDLVTELAGQGTDTVVSSTAYFLLPANLENLILTAAGPTWAVAGYGNQQDNVITATGDGTHVLDGGAGNDVLVGSAAGADRFIVARGEGSDAVVGFTSGQDVLQLDGSGLTSFAAVLAATTQVGADAVIGLGGGEAVVLRGVSKDSLMATDLALPISTAGMRLTFDDEFSGPLSSSPLATGKTADGQDAKWRSRYDQGPGGGRSLNGESEYYSDSSVGTNPFSVNDGVLTITASPASVSGANALGVPYNSGAITTSKSFAQQYGYFEVRAQLPAGQGFWPAFWMLPTDGTWPPEIDVFEVLGRDPATVYSSIHTSAAGSSNSATTAVVHVADTSAGFHTYGLLWDAATIRWYFDGNQVASVATPADMNKPMYMLLNLAVGGSWAGAPDGTSSAQMKLDYVRAYATEGTVSVSGTAAIGPGSAAAIATASVATTTTAAATTATAAVGTSATGATGTTTTAATTQAAQPTALALTGTGASIVRADGLFAVAGGGSNGRVLLGDGNQSVVLTGSRNTVQLGRGNHAVTLSGDGNVVAVGAGASRIDVGGGFATVTVGAGTAGTTTVKAAGAYASVTATGDGSVQVSGTTGNATVTLRDGNHSVMLGGTGNVVILGNGSCSVSAGTGQAVVRTGSGNDTIRVAGYGNLLDGGAGRNTLIGGTGHDTFVLNAPVANASASGGNMDRISGFALGNGDLLDLTRTLAGAAVARDMSDLGRFVTASNGTEGTTLLLDATGGHGAATAFATLLGVKAGVADLVGAHAIMVNGRVA